MDAKNLVIIFSSVNKALAFEWLAEGIDKKKFNTRFVLLNNDESQLENFLKGLGFPVERIPCKGKFSFLKVIIKLYFYFKKHKTEIVHCHLFEANLCGLSAAWLAGVKKRIYTRHHSTLQHTYFARGVKYDKWCNSRATHIVAVSKVVTDTLVEMENVAPGKVSIIYHGLKRSYIENLAGSRVQNLRNKYKIPAASPVVGLISRYLHLKGVTYAIEAFSEIKKSYPNAFLILANASGDYKKQVQQALQKLPASSFCEIEFEEDLAALYKLFDVFVHVPVDSHSEAFGQTYTEALALGIPSVFTISGVASEFIKNEVNALVVDYKNSSQIASAIQRILSDSDLRERLIKNGKENVKAFDIEKELGKLELLYLS